MNLTELFRAAVNNYLGSGVEFAGQALIGPAWPLVKPAVESVLKVVEARIDGITTPDKRLERIMEEFERDDQLRALFQASLEVQLAPLLDAQERTRQEVSDAQWELALLVAKSRDALSEQVESVRRKLESGVTVAELGPEMVAQIMGVMAQFGSLVRGQIERGIAATANRRKERFEKLKELLDKDLITVPPDVQDAGSKMSPLEALQRYSGDLQKGVYQHTSYQRFLFNVVAQRLLMLRLMQEELFTAAGDQHPHRERKLNEEGNRFLSWILYPDQEDFL